MEKPGDNDLHPIRFTNKQVRLIKHIMGHFSDYFEEEAEEFFETIKEAEAQSGGS